MQFLADESCDALIVRTLRQLGHDVTYIAELAPGDLDEMVLSRSVTEKRILITEDRDFCELVYRDHHRAHGIILVRIAQAQRQEKAARITTLVNTNLERVTGSMTTLTLNTMKVRPLPE